MFYRIKDNKLYDYSDFKYEIDCLELPGYTTEYLLENYEAFEVQNDVLVNIENTPKYRVIADKISREKRRLEIEKELNELDLKRIRAIAEPELKDAESGETWLNYYNTQIKNLREEYAELQS